MKTLLALTAIALAGVPISAQEPPPLNFDEPGSWLEVHLVTAAPGDAIWERFSHNAIWIRDHKARTDIAYNWGIFDFRQESFIKRLAQGRMLYAMYGLDMGRMVDSYRADDRAVYSNQVNLTPSERLELQQILQAMDTDENRFYRYDYYADNCSTRVRDALDQVLGGQIAQRWESVGTPASYRWHTRRLTRSVLWAYLGIQFVVGNPGDRRISAFEEMFLPLKLMDYLENTERTLHGGETEPLLAARDTLYASSRPPVPQDVPSMMLPLLMLGLAIGAVIAGLGRAGARGSAGGRWGFALLGGGWGIVTALLGSGLLLSWALTDHRFWRWNENIFSINPLGFLVAGALLMAAASGRWDRAARWSLWLVGLSALGVVLQILPGFDQYNGEIAVLVLPVHIAIAWAANRFRTMPTSS